MGRFLVIAILLIAGYLLAKRYLYSLAGRLNRNDDAGAGTTELVQDPQCGIYFVKQQGVEARIGGQTVHFCSESCRGKYLDKHRSG
jgi:hypothetical protein